MSPIRLTQATCLILHALATGRRHGFQIMDVTGLESGTVYPVLRRLERERLVTSEWEDEEQAQEAGRPKRRVYELTPEGVRYAARASKRLADTRRLLRDTTWGDAVPSEGRGS